MIATHACPKRCKDRGTPNTIADLLKGVLAWLTERLITTDVLTSGLNKRATNSARGGGNIPRFLLWRHQLLADLPYIVAMVRYKAAADSAGRAPDYGRRADGA